MADEADINFRARIDFSQAGEDVRAFESEGVKLTPRAGAAGGIAPRGVSGDPASIERSSARYASALDRLVIATERMVSSMERAAGGSGGGGGPPNNPPGGGGGVPGRSFLGPLGRRFLGPAALYWMAREQSASQTAQEVARASINGADTYAQYNSGLAQMAKAEASGIGGALGVRDLVYGLVKPSWTTDAYVSRLESRSRTYQRDVESYEMGVSRDEAETQRGAYAQGGERGERLSGVYSKAREQQSKLDIQIAELQALKPRSWKDMTPEELREVQSRDEKIYQLQQQRGEVMTQADFEWGKVYSEREIARGHLVAEGLDASDIARGTSRRRSGYNALLRRQGLERSKQEREDKELMPELLEKQKQDRDAYDAIANQNGTYANIENRGRARSASFRASNNAPFAAASDLQWKQEVEENKTRDEDPSQLPALRKRQQEDRDELAASTMRAIRRSSRSNTGEAAVLSLLLGRDELGAAVAGNENARVDELDNTDAFSRLFLSAGINAKYLGRGQLIRQRFQDSRDLDAIGLRGALESSGLRAGGKNVSADAQDILDSTNQRATAYSQRGDTDAKNLVLATGINQLAALQRRIQFGGYGEEVAPGSLGSGSERENNPQGESTLEALNRIDTSIKSLQEALVGNGE